jgi:dipeptidyl aminopeptidase/acylaminoacyl peptidase
MLFRRTWAILGLSALAAFGAPQAAPDPLSTESYIKPSAALQKAVLAPWHLHVSATNISPDRTRFIHVQSEGPARIANLARPSMNLAGLQIDPVAERSRNATMRQNTGLLVKSFDGAKDIEIQLPKGSSPGTPEWSPDSTRIAFVNNMPDGTLLYMADPATGKSWPVGSRKLLATRVTSIEWVKKGTALVVVLVPTKRPALPGATEAPAGPLVRVSDDKPNSLRTYADLMTDSLEADTLKHFTTGQLALVDASNGAVTEIGEPKMYASIDPSPTGDWFIVNATEEPFSYLFPFSSFPSRQVIIGIDGKEVFEVSKRGLPTAADDGADSDQMDSDQMDSDDQSDEQRTGGGQRGGAGQAAPTRGEQPKRGLSWRPDGAGLSYMQKTPADDAGKQKDRLLLWKAPFAKDAADVVYETDGDLGTLLYTNDGRAFLTQSAGTETTISILELRRGATPRKVFSFKTGPNEEPVGSLVSMQNENGGTVALLTKDGKYAFLSGTKQPKDPRAEAPRPFLNRLDLESGKTEQIFMSSADAYETASILDAETTTLLINRQSPTTPNNVFVRRGDKETKLTNNIDYLPEVTQAKQERIQVTRQDGIKFWATVTRPEWMTTGHGKKSMFWFYPSEVRNQAGIDAVGRNYNRNAFRKPSASSIQLLILEGYVVVEPDCPIVGTAERPNDGYVPQLRNNLAATIDALEAADMIDRRLLAIGGHSYGAFSTANAMVNTPYFKAGIAGDGNFNRSLTPFGFQAEPRQLWEARDVYYEMSPIWMADRITGALLMYHGAWDQNVGTDPINSPRMYAALEALGKPCAMYVYPYEDHGQIAIESRLDMWARWTAWLNKWLVLPEDKKAGS